MVFCSRAHCLRMCPYQLFKWGAVGNPFMVKVGNLIRDPFKITDCEILISIPVYPVVNRG